MKKVDQLLEDAALVESVYEAQGNDIARAGRMGDEYCGGSGASAVDPEGRAVLELRHAGARSTSEPGLSRVHPIGDEKVPDAKTLARLGQVIGREVIGELHERLMELARERGVVQGRKMRVDTTVVETNIHYPTDSVY